MHILSFDGDFIYSWALLKEYTLQNINIVTYLGFPWWHDLCTLLRFHSNVTVPVA
jgi:hypothetical protein